MPHISTPCVNLCVIDESSGLCRGCGRTRAEIARWTTLCEEERRRIMAGLQGRLAGIVARAEREKA